MQRVVGLVLAVAMICVLVLPVTAHADERESTWIELLETATVDDSGSNLAKVVGMSGRFRIKTPQYMRLTKIDILLTHPAGYAPSSVKIEYNGTLYTLNRAVLDDNTTRFYGSNIPDTLYADVVIEINKTYDDYTCSYQFLSCKVSSIVSAEFVADAYMLINNVEWTCPNNYDISGLSDESTQHMQFPIVVKDWQKYDSLTIVGSIGRAALNSVRVTIGGQGIPYEMTYTSSNPTGSESDYYLWTDIQHYEYDDSYKGTIEESTLTNIEYNGKTLYCIIIDLTGIDRSLTSPLACYFTCVVHGYYGYSLQVVGVTGSINTADTTNVTWWQRFTTFMTDLFAGSADTPNKMEQVQEQSQELAEDRLGAVYQAGQVVDGLVGAFQNQTATEYLTVPVLTVPLGEVDWTIGGWEVQVVPDAFKPIVEILKTVIDIVCTLAFLKSMRARFEKLLVGGNA